jgi:7-cyano-7-deazaguanine synthase
MTEPRIPEVLLFSAGLDSYPAWHYLGRPPGLYFDLGHRYASQERAAVAALSDAAGIEIEISDELRLGAWEAEDAIIPLRNVHLAMLASNRAEMVWCIGVKGDHTLDKSRDAFADMGRFIARFSEKPTRVDSPFWDMTKTDIIAWYLAQGLPVEHLLLTFSCSRTDGSTVHCGRCSSCLRRWSTTASKPSSSTSPGPGIGSASSTSRPCAVADTPTTGLMSSSQHWPPSVRPWRADPTPPTLE